MKKFIHKVQELGRKADELKTVVQSLPGKAAELRQAVTMSAGELHQIRSEVQADLTGLRAGNEDRLLQAMREINDHTYTFEEAGYELAEMELDLASNQRLAVHLQKFDDVSNTAMRTLLGKQTSETIKSILSGLIKAEETAANVELTHLRYDGVILHVGAIPLIRLCWSSDTLQEAQQTLATAVKPSAPTPMPSSPAFGSFFEQQKQEPRTIGTSTVSQPTSVLPNSSEPVATPTKIETTIEVASPKNANRWSRESLERFKKMPSGSKYSR